MNVPSEHLQSEYDALDRQIAALEESVGSAVSDLKPVLAHGVHIAAELLRSFALAHAKPMPVGEDLLELFKAFVKGEPSLNTVRDNVRELVYYQNCLVMDRSDALPAKPERMVAHTVRHIYLYLRSRAEQEGLIG